MLLLFCVSVWCRLLSVVIGFITCGRTRFKWSDPRFLSLHEWRADLWFIYLFLPPVLFFNPSNTNEHSVMFWNLVLLVFWFALEFRASAACSSCTGSRADSGHSLSHFSFRLQRSVCVACVRSCFTLYKLQMITQDGPVVLGWMC